MTSSEFTIYMDQYRFNEDWVIVPGESGMNNTTRMIKAGNDRYVLRVYNNHKDQQIVQLEHEVLKALYAQMNRLKVPAPVKNVHNETVTASSEGTLATLNHFIHGERPSILNLSHIRSLGIAAAELSVALSLIEPLSNPIYEPYYKLEQTYSALDESAMSSIILSDIVFLERKVKFDALQVQRNKLVTEMEAIQLLPHQWIHGDLNFSNSVSVLDDVVGILDFEFCTIDVRAMELAVVIIDLITDDDTLSMERIALFCQGFGSKLKLTERESDSIPVLMKLRMLDVTIHFVTRWNEQLDDSSVLTGIVDQAYRVCEWIDKNDEQLRSLTQELLVENL